jgi:hypothetical protein
VKANRTTTSQLRCSSTSNPSPDPPTSGDFSGIQEPDFSGNQDSEFH